MKIILTESQVKRLVTEQSEGSFDRRYSTASAAEKSNAGNKQMVKALINMDPHTRNTILAIGVAFIPVVGPALSMGVAAYDAKLYWNEGKKKTRGPRGRILPGKCPSSQLHSKSSSACGDG